MRVGEIRHQLPDGRRGDVIVWIPEAVGWINSVKFFYWQRGTLKTVGLNYAEQLCKNNCAAFKGTVSFDAGQPNQYFFQYQVGNKTLYDRHIRENCQWASEHAQAKQFYDEVHQYLRENKVPRFKNKIISISPQHLIIEGDCGKFKVLVIINRSSQMTRISIPEQYAKVQAIFCDGRIDNDVFPPKSSVVLKIK